MKLVLCGKSFIACDSLEYAIATHASLAHQVEILCVPNESDRGVVTWEPSFRAAANAQGLPVLPSVDDAELAVGDVLVSLEYDRLIRERSLHGARAYNIHFSLLPAYRGCITSVWPLRNRESHSGVTLHVLTPGIDDGPVVDQTAFDIGPSETAYDLYLAYSHHAAALFRRNLSAITSGRHGSTDQDESKATYYSRRSVDWAQRELVSFDRRATEVSAWVRSMIFPPYQLPEYAGRRIERVEIEPHPKRSCYPGTLIESDVATALVMCGDFPVRLHFAT